jgi:anthranilate/para-aminobenzoate synthase component II
MAPDQIVISPGPGRPEEAGISVDVVRASARHADPRRLPRASGDWRGVRRYGVPRATPMHGKTSTIVHDGKGVFAGIDDPFPAGAVSLARDRGRRRARRPGVAARTEDGTIMAVRHRTYPVHGVQFHPESVLTDEGRTILRNFLDM